MTRPDPRDFARALPEEGRLVLTTHRHPDPDGLGAMVGIEYLLKTRFGIAADFVLEGRIRRAENLAMREILGIDALPKGGVDPAQYAGVVVVDAQPGFSHTHPPGALPVLAVIDHHRGSEEAAPEDVPFFWVAPDYGATSTMVWDLLRAFDLEPDERTATALFCGVRYDTNNLLREAGPRDEEAFRELERRANRRMVAEIDQPPLPRHWFVQMHEAIETCRLSGGLVLTLLGEVRSPETVAEVADWFMRLDGAEWSLAGGACDGVYQVSLRTDLPGADAYPTLRAILDGEGACGGHGRMAGGQLRLDGADLEEVRERLRGRARSVLAVGDAPEEPLIPPVPSTPRNR